MQHTVRQIDADMQSQTCSHRHADTDMHSQTPSRLLRREGADAGVKKAIEMVLRESTGKEERGIGRKIEKYTAQRRYNNQYQ